MRYRRLRNVRISETLPKKTFVAPVNSKLACVLLIYFALPEISLTNVDIKDYEIATLQTKKIFIYNTLSGYCDSRWSAWARESQRAEKAGGIFINLLLRSQHQTETSSYARLGRFPKCLRAASGKGVCGVNSNYMAITIKKIFLF